MHISIGVLLWFALLAVPLVWADLRDHSDQKEIGLCDAALWSAAYVAGAMVFALGLLATRGASDASLFLTGYALEKVLSVDNLMIWTSVFLYFGVEDGYRNRILKWGILGAVLTRGLAVLVGVSAIGVFGRVAEVGFACFIAWSVVEMLKGGDDDDEPIDHEARWYIKAARKFFPVDAKAEGSFFVRQQWPFPGKMEFEKMGIQVPPPLPGRLMATRFFLCLVAIEITDVMFAGDSVPAIVAVTKDPSLIMSSMVFAMLGLRSMYFVLVALQRYMVHLEKAVVAVLAFVTLKLALHGVLGYEIDSTLSLAIILLTLVAGVVASLLSEPETATKAGPAPTGPS